MIFTRTTEVGAADRTSLQGTIAISPRALVETFGRPDQGEESKVSGEYVFVSDAGSVFTLYDWKLTTRWDEDGMSPERLWDSREPVVLNVGSRDGESAGDFTDWLRQQVCPPVRTCGCPCNHILDPAD